MFLALPVSFCFIDFLMGVFKADGPAVIQLERNDCGSVLSSFRPIKPSSIQTLPSVLSDGPASWTTLLREMSCLMLPFFRLYPVDWLPLFRGPTIKLSSIQTLPGELHVSAGPTCYCLLRTSWGEISAHSELSAVAFVQMSPIINSNFPPCFFSFFFYG